MAAASEEPADKRIPVLVVAALCCVAWAVGELTREPWPFPIFPGFGSLPATQEAGQPDVRRVFVMLHDEEAVNVELADMFEDAPDSFYSPMTESFIAVDAHSPDVELRRWVDARADAQPGWNETCVQAIELIELAVDDQQVGPALQRLEFPACQ